MGVIETGARPTRTTGRVVAVGLTGALLGTVLTLALAGTGNDGVSAPPGDAVPQESLVQESLVQGSLVQEPSGSASTPISAPDPAPTPAPDPPADQVAAEAPPATTGEATAPPAQAAAAPGPLSPPAPPGGSITAEEAGLIAAAHVGGTVDDVYVEDGDHGAAWDVDVYAPDGEYTIYVSSTGEVVHVDGPYRD
jgi:hypothetical protein